MLSLVIEQGRLFSILKNLKSILSYHVIMICLRHSMPSNLCQTEGFRQPGVVALISQNSSWKSLVGIVVNDLHISALVSRRGLV